MEGHTNVIDFSDCDLKNITTEDEILEMLPNAPTKVCTVEIIEEDLLQISFMISAKSGQEFKEWLRTYEAKSFSTYSISYTSPCTGKRILFKQNLHCQHNTQCSRTYEPHKNNRTRNTNCRASLNVTVRAATKRKYQGKDPAAAPNPLFPCEIVAVTSHNHNLQSVDSLRFRAVSEETKTKLIVYYQNGHTPATALDNLKSEIQLTFENYETILADRKFCPDYNYCYYLFRKEFKEKYGPLEFNSDDKKFLENSAPLKLIKQELDPICDTVEEGPGINEISLVEDSETLIDKGSPICDEFSNVMKKFLKNSPHEVLPAITAGLSKALKMNTAVFASAFINFGSGFKKE